MAQPQQGDAFDLLDREAHSAEPSAIFEMLVRRALDERDYALLYQARVLEQRYRLGLPLMQTDAPASEKQAAYQEALLNAAREAGTLYLEAGDVARAWPFFRAIGETAPVAEALERVSSTDSTDRMVEIAFHEGVNPRKGFQLVLENYGICRAITYYGAYPDPVTRSEALAMLVKALHDELVSRVRQAIAEVEGQCPAGGLPQLIAGRAWLFEGMSYHADPSHIASIVQFAIEAEDRETLRRGLDMAEYGRRLSSMFQLRGESPFEEPYTDFAIYLRALLGEEVEAGTAHFRKKLEQAAEAGPAAREAEVLTALLVRLGRYEEAIQVCLDHPADEAAGRRGPSVYQLCEMARDFDRWSGLAREQGNLLAYAAALLRRWGDESRNCRRTAEETATSS